MSRSASVVGSPGPSAHSTTLARRYDGSSNSGRSFCFGLTQTKSGSPRLTPAWATMQKWLLRMWRR